MIRRDTARAFLLLVLGMAGCNAILGNKPGEPKESNAPDAARADAGPHVAYGDRDTEDASAAPDGAPDAGCDAHTCIIQRCTPGNADCNHDPTDGCEVDLSRVTSCGACDRVCPPAAPLCAPADGGFQCTTGCSPAAPIRCGDECVSPLTNIHHCGGCNIRCPELAQATTECTAGNCRFSCKPGFEDCNLDPIDGCESNLGSDRMNCGACGRSCDGGVCTNGTCSVVPDAG